MKDKSKCFRIIYGIIMIIFIVFFVKYEYNEILLIKRYISFYKDTRKNDIFFLEFDKKIEQENEFYKNAINLNYESILSEIPYIPEGFEYVEGEWSSGFVVQDENKNQYVWIPCGNRENNEILKLEKNNFKKPAFISKDSCVDDEYEEFITSTLKNGGFYISRYEIGKEENNPVSKSQVEVWTNITKKEAVEVISKMYENINCKLINGYAYDTTLSWIKKNNIIQASKIESENILTGRQEYNNIYDFCDNIMEFSQEISYGSPVIRGFLDDENNSNESRYTIFEDERTFAGTRLIAIRTVLYK